jgi:hypothetical protein
VAFVGQFIMLAHGPTDLSATANELIVSVWVRLGRLVSYFTIESNLLVLAVAVSLVLAPGRGRLWRVVRLDASSRWC